MCQNWLGLICFSAGKWWCQSPPVLNPWWLWSHLADWEESVWLLWFDYTSDLFLQVLFNICILFLLQWSRSKHVWSGNCLQNSFVTVCIVWIKENGDFAISWQLSKIWDETVHTLHRYFNHMSDITQQLRRRWWQSSSAISCTMGMLGQLYTG